MVEMAMGPFEFDKEFVKLDKEHLNLKNLKKFSLTSTRTSTSRKPPPEKLHSIRTPPRQTMQSIQLLANLLVC